MKTQDELFMDQSERELAIAEQQMVQGQAQQDTQAVMLREQEKSLIKEQLNLVDELETIEHLLKGEVLEQIKDGEEGDRHWVSPDDPEMIILTQHGVHLIMNTILFYLNKNTLLSNYDEDIINRKMEDFSTDLADTIFMEYEKVFNYPTFEQCRLKLEERLDRKTELRQYAYKLIGKKVSDESIKAEFVEEIEDKIENEITKIREQIIKNKLKRFLIIMRTVQDAVHSTYLRAWNGQERRTLRQHIHISEVMGNNQPQQQTKQSRRSPFGMMRR